jgi:hypothetical protein
MIQVGVYIQADITICKYLLPIIYTRMQLSKITIHICECR